MARSRRYGRGKSKGYYKFTPKRKAALRKAQFVSAKNRKGKTLTNGKKIAIGVGVLTAVAAVGVVGYQNRDRIGQGRNADWRKTADPNVKERTRSGNSVSVAHPSQTTSVTPDSVQAPRMSTPITDSDRAKAAAHRQNEKAKEAKRVKSVLGSDVEDIDAYEREAARQSSENQIDRQVRGVLRATKRPGGTARVTGENRVKSPLQLVEEGIPKATRGRRTGSLRGTPGGTKTPKKAVRPNTPDGLTDEEHAAATGFDTELYTPAASFQRSRGVVRKDELHTLAGMRAADEKLLREATEAPKKAAKKAAPKKTKAKPAAPTAGTNTTADAMPTFSDAPAEKAMPGMNQANKKLAELKRGAKQNLGIQDGDYVSSWDMLNDTQKMGLRKAALVWGHDISAHGKYYIVPGVASGARG